jgi:hypothetical protein
MSRLADELDRGKIKCRRSALFRKKQKKQETKDERYISRCVISIELEHSNDHWQRSSIEREGNMENSNIYRSTDRGRNPIWLLSHYITLFVINYNFVKKRGKRGFLRTRRPKRGVFGKKRGKGIKKTGSGMPGNYSE